MFRVRMPVKATTVPTHPHPDSTTLTFHAVSMIRKTGQRFMIAEAGS